MAKKERSYGIIPLRKSGKVWKTLLVLHGKGHWAFPKGHAERGESPLEAATRELEEETGLTIVRFLPGSPLEEHYFFTWEGEKVEKWVEYYLAEVSGALSLQKEEVSDARWLSLQEAEELVTFPESKRLCQEVITLLPDQ